MNDPAKLTAGITGCLMLFMLYAMFVLITGDTPAQRCEKHHKYGSPEYLECVKVLSREK